MSYELQSKTDSTCFTYLALGSKGEMNNLMNEYKALRPEKEYRVREIRETAYGVSKGGL